MPLGNVVCVGWCLTEFHCRKKLKWGYQQRFPAWWVFYSSPLSPLMYFSWCQQTVYVSTWLRIKRPACVMLTAVLLICVHLICFHCHLRTGGHSHGAAKSPVLAAESIEHNPALKAGSFSRNQDWPLPRTGSGISLSCSQASALSYDPEPD